MTVSGIINVDKSEGISSHRVVALIRKRSKISKVGHAGTLDPLATGVLVLLVGKAARISEYIMDLPKTYRTTVRLGIATDTYDREGEVVSTAAVNITEGDLRSALSRFVGEIEQQPPPYSAAKVEGERAYRLARQGKAVAVASRPVTIYRIDLGRFEPPDVEIEIECGKGTYVRSIAHDLGAILGCGGHVWSLRRTRVGPFPIDDAVDVETLERELEDGTWTERVQPLDIGLAHLPALTVDIEDEKDLRHGQAVDLAEVAITPETSLSDRLLSRGYAEDGSLIGILRYDAAANLWRPRKILS